MYLIKPVLLSTVIWLVVQSPLSRESTTLFAQDFPGRLKILSYNIHHGEGVDKKLDLERIAKLISESDADIVALQEVDVNTSRSQHVDQAKKLATMTKMNFVFGPNIKFGGGKYGNAILTRHKILKSKNFKLPNHNDGEQRGVLRATIEVKGWKQPILFLATHFDHRRDDVERVASAKFVNQKIEIGDGQYCFLAGDFNDVIGSPTLRLLEKKWVMSHPKELPTVPVDRPKRQIDFVFSAKGQSGQWVSTRVLDESIASDHRAVLTEYKLVK